MPQRHRQRLERALRPMMIVFPPQTIDVEGNLGLVGEALHDVRNVFAAQVANPLPLQTQVDAPVGPPGEVDHGAGEGLVEGAVSVAEAGEAADGAEGLLESRTEGDGAVFSRVVVVDC